MPNRTSPEMDHIPEKGQHFRGTVADSAEDPTELDEFPSQRQEARSNGRIVSSGISKVVHTSTSPERDRPRPDLGKSKRETRRARKRPQNSLNCDAETGKIYKVYSNMKSQIVGSLGCSDEKAHDVEHQSVGEHPILEHGNIGDDFCSASERLPPGDMFSRGTNQDPASVRPVKDNLRTNREGQSIIQDRNRNLIHHRSTKVEDVDLFIEEETVCNPRQKLAIREEEGVHTNIVPAARSSKDLLTNGPSCKANIATRNSHLPFQGVCQSLVDSDESGPGTDEQCKNELQVGEQPETKAKPNPKKDRSFTSNSAPRDDIEETQYTTCKKRKERSMCSRDVMEPDTQRIVPLSTGYDENSRSPVPLSEDVGYLNSWLQASEGLIQDKSFRQREILCQHSRNSPHSQDRVPPMPSLTSQKKARAYDSVKVTRDSSNFDFYRKDMLNCKKQASTHRSPHAPERRTSPDRDYRGTKQHSSPNRTQRSADIQSSPNSSPRSAYIYSIPNNSPRSADIYSSPNSSPRSADINSSSNCSPSADMQNSPNGSTRSADIYSSPNGSPRSANIFSSPNGSYRSTERYSSPSISYRSMESSMTMSYKGTKRHSSPCGSQRSTQRHSSPNETNTSTERHSSPNVFKRIVDIHSSTNGSQRITGMHSSPSGSQRSTKRHSSPNGSQRIIGMHSSPNGSQRSAEIVSSPNASQKSRDGQRSSKRHSSSTGCLRITKRHSNINGSQISPERHRSTKRNRSPNGSPKRHSSPKRSLKNVNTHRSPNGLQRSAKRHSSSNRSYRGTENSLNRGSKRLRSQDSSPKNEDIQISPIGSQRSIKGHTSPSGSKRRADRHNSPNGSQRSSKRHSSRNGNQRIEKRHSTPNGTQRSTKRHSSRNGSFRSRESSLNVYYRGTERHTSPKRSKKRTDRHSSPNGSPKSAKSRSSGNKSQRSTKRNISPNGSQRSKKRHNGPNYSQSSKHRHSSPYRCKRSTGRRSSPNGSQRSADIHSSPNGSQRSAKRHCNPNGSYRSTETSLNMSYRDARKHSSPNGSHRSTKRHRSPDRSERRTERRSSPKGSQRCLDIHSRPNGSHRSAKRHSSPDGSERRTERRSSSNGSQRSPKRHCSLNRSHRSMKTSLNPSHSGTKRHSSPNGSQRCAVRHSTPNSFHRSVKRHCSLNRSYSSTETSLNMSFISSQIPSSSHGSLIDAERHSSPNGSPESTKRHSSPCRSQRRTERQSSPNETNRSTERLSSPNGSNRNTERHSNLNGSQRSVDILSSPNGLQRIIGIMHNSPNGSQRGTERYSSPNGSQRSIGKHCSLNESQGSTEIHSSPRGSQRNLGRHGSPNASNSSKEIHNSPNGSKRITERHSSPNGSHRRLDITSSPGESQRSPERHSCPNGSNRSTERHISPNDLQRSTERHSSPNGSQISSERQSSPNGYNRSTERHSSPIGSNRSTERQSSPNGSQRNSERHSSPDGSNRSTERHSSPNGSNKSAERHSSPAGFQRSTDSNSFSVGTKRHSSPNGFYRGAQRHSNTNEFNRVTQSHNTINEFNRSTQRHTNSNGFNIGTQRPITPNGFNIGTQRPITPNGLYTGTQRLITPNGFYTGTQGRSSINGFYSTQRHINPNEVYRGNQRHRSPNGLFRGTQRHSSPSRYYGDTQNRNYPQQSSEGCERRFSPNRCFSRRTDGYSSPKRFSRASGDIDTISKTGLSLHTTPHVDYPKLHCTESDNTAAFLSLISAGRLSLVSSNSSDHGILKFTGPNRCTSTTASDVAYQPARHFASESVSVESIARGHSRHGENREHQHARQGYAVRAADLVQRNADRYAIRPLMRTPETPQRSLQNRTTSYVCNSTCGVTFRQGEGQSRRGICYESFESIAQEDNWIPLNTPAMASHNTELVDGVYLGNERKALVEQARSIKPKEVLLGRGQSSYSRPQPIEIVDKESRVLNRPTSASAHSADTKATDMHTELSSVSIYTKVPNYLLKLCVPADPRRHYLRLVDISDDKLDLHISDLKTPLLEETKRESASLCNVVGNAQEVAINVERSSELQLNEINASKKMDDEEKNASKIMDDDSISQGPHHETDIMFAKIITNRRKRQTERIERKKFNRENKFSKFQLLRLLGTLCRTRKPVAPIQEDETMFAESSSTPKLFTRQENIVDDACSMVSDLCSTVNDECSMVGDVCNSDSQAMFGSHFSVSDLNSKLCQGASESEELKLDTPRAPQSLRNLCFSVLSQHPCSQTDNLPHLEHTISMKDRLIVSDFLRIGSENDRLNYKRSYSETFLGDESSRLVQLPEEKNTRFKKMHTGIQRDKAQMDANNNNESEDEMDTEDCHQSNRPPEICERVVFDDMSTPIVLSASDRVYHVSKCSNGWSSATYREASTIYEDTVPPDASFVTPDTITKRPNDGCDKTDSNLPNFLDLVDTQESHLFETDGPTKTSEDILARAMSSAGLADYVVDNFMKCDPAIEPHLFLQMFQVDKDGSNGITDVLDLSFEGDVFGDNVANLNEDKSDCSDTTVKRVQSVNPQAINWSTSYFGRCYKEYEYTCENDSPFENAGCGTLNHIKNEWPIEVVNAMSAGLNHDELGQLDSPLCHTQSQYSMSRASKRMSSGERTFPEVIPDIGITNSPYRDERCIITHDSRQLTEALSLLSEDESSDFGDDFQANINIANVDNDSALHQSQNFYSNEKKRGQCKKQSSNTPSDSIEKIANTTAHSLSKTILRQREPESERFVKAVAAFTAYDVVEIPQTKCYSDDKKESSRDKSYFTARTLDCVNRYGLRSREPNKRIVKTGMKRSAPNDRELKCKVKKLKQKMTKGSVGRKRLDAECIAESGVTSLTSSSDVKNLKSNVQVTRSNSRDTEVPCAERDFLDDTRMQETIDDTLLDAFPEEQVNHGSGETPNSTHVNTRENIENVTCKLPSAREVEDVSPCTLTNYFDRQQQSMELFKQQMCKVSPGFLKHIKKFKTRQPSNTNRITTKIVHVLKCNNKCKMSSVEKKEVMETDQPQPEDFLDFNNNASWDNIEPESSKLKVAKTDKGKDSKRVSSCESRLHLPRVFDRTPSMEKEKKRLEKISDKFRKQYQSLHQAPRTLSLLPQSGVSSNGNNCRSHISSTEMGQLPDIGHARSSNENQNKGHVYGACTLPVMKAPVQENSKVLNFVKRLDSRYGDQLAHGDVDTSRRLKKCCKSYLTKHGGNKSGNKSTGPSLADKRMKDCRVSGTPCKTSDKIDEDIDILAAHNSNLLDSSAAFNPTTEETLPVETAEPHPTDASNPPGKLGVEGNACCSGQASAKCANASSARKQAENKTRQSTKRAPLRSDIATSVNRLAAKPASPTTRLMYKIQNYEQEFKKPFNINETTPAKQVKATPKFSREKYTYDIQKVLPACGGGGVDMTHCLEANKPIRSLDSASRESLTGRCSSKLVKKAMGGLPKRFDDFPDGAIKDDQLETRQTIMASLPLELKLDEGKEQKKSARVVTDAFKMTNRISPLKYIDINESQSEGTNLEIQSLAQLKQVSERAFSLEFPDIFNQGQRSSPLSNSIVEKAGTINMNNRLVGIHKHSEEASSIEIDCESTSSCGQHDVKQKRTGASPLTSNTQKEFYSIALPAGISEELMKEIENNPEPKPVCEEMKSLEEELQDFLNECGHDDKDLNDYYMLDFDGVGADEEEVFKLDTRSQSNQLENRSGSNQLENGSPKGSTRTSVSGESGTFTSPRTYSQIHKTKPGRETPNFDTGGGGDSAVQNSTDPRPGSCDDADSSCDIFKVESLTSIKRSVDCAFEDQCSDTTECSVSGMKEDGFWGDAADYWTDSNNYVPERRSFKKLTPIQEDLEEDNSVTRNEQ